MDTESCERIIIIPKLILGNKASNLLYLGVLLLTTLISCKIFKDEIQEFRFHPSNI